MSKPKLKMLFIAVILGFVLASLSYFMTSESGGQYCTAYMQVQTNHGFPFAYYSYSQGINNDCGVNGQINANLQSDNYTASNFSGIKFVEDWFILFVVSLVSLGVVSNWLKRQA